MAEKISLAQEQLARPGTTEWEIEQVELHRGLRWDEDTQTILPDPENSHVRIRLYGQRGIPRQHIYSGQEAYDMIIALNKANLSTKSLERRVFEKLIADGKEAGAISGSAD